MATSTTTTVQTGTTDTTAADATQAGTCAGDTSGAADGSAETGGASQASGAASNPVGPSTAPPGAAVGRSDISAQWAGGTPPAGGLEHGDTVIGGVDADTFRFGAADGQGGHAPPPADHPSDIAVAGADATDGFGGPEPTVPMDGTTASPEVPPGAGQEHDPGAWHGYGFGDDSIFG